MQERNTLSMRNASLTIMVLRVHDVNLLVSYLFIQKRNRYRSSLDHTQQV